MPATSVLPPDIRNRSGLPATRAAITRPTGRQTQKRSCANSFWPDHRLLTASRLPKCIAAWIFNWTRPPCAAGPSLTLWLIRSNPAVNPLPSAAGNALRSARSGNWMPRLTVGSPETNAIIHCLISWMTVPASAPALKFTTQKIYWLTSTFCPPLSLNMACRSNSTWTTTASSSHSDPRP